MLNLLLRKKLLTTYFSFQYQHQVKDASYENTESHQFFDIVVFYYQLNSQAQNWMAYIVTCFENLQLDQAWVREWPDCVRMWKLARTTIFILYAFCLVPRPMDWKRKEATSDDKLVINVFAFLFCSGAFLASSQYKSWLRKCTCVKFLRPI